MAWNVCISEMFHIPVGHGACGFISTTYVGGWVSGVIESLPSKSQIFLADRLSLLFTIPYKQQGKESTASQALHIQCFPQTSSCKVFTCELRP
jgi:hypothetical protein